MTLYKRFYGGSAPPGRAGGRQSVSTEGLNRPKDDGRLKALEINPRYNPAACHSQDANFSCFELSRVTGAPFDGEKK